MVSTKFRKKPVVIEAYQMTSERRWKSKDWPEWLREAWNKDPSETGSLWCDKEIPHAAADLYITTLEGVMDIDWNDWIIKGIQNEIYPCKPDIFEMTYESVED